MGCALFDSTFLRSILPTFKILQTKMPLGTHHADDEYRISCDPMKDPQGPNNKVTISRIWKIMGHRTHLRKVF